MPHNFPLPDDRSEDFQIVAPESLKEYWYIFLRHRWLIAAVVVGVLALTCVGTLLQTPQFKATALIRIDQGKINLVQDFTVEEGRPGFREFYGTQRRVLTSRNLARRTMDELDVWSHPLFQSGGDLEEPPLGDVRDQQIDKLLEMLKVTHVRNTQIMEVCFLTPDPELARDLANTLVGEYIASSVEAESGVARNTTSFIREQIEKLQRGIHEKETLLQEYGKQQDVVLEQSDDILAQQLSELHHELTQAQSELANAKARYMSLEQSDPRSLPEVYNNRTIQNLQQEHASLEKEYAELGTKFEPLWPEMQRKRSALEEVGRRLALETKSLADKLRLSARANYQEALNRVSLLNKTLEGQRQETRDVNALTTEYHRIKVELESQQAMLEQLTRREGETGLSAEFEERQQISVGIVEDAVFPRKPFKPNLLLNLLVGGIIGIVLGPGLAFFVNYWDSAIYTSEDLQRYSQVPCLGIIPHYAYEKQVSGPNRARLSSGVVKQDNVGALASRSKILPAWAKSQHPTEGEVLERFKFLRNALLLSSPGVPPKTVLFTSGGKGEGKSFVARNFAASFAQLNKRVLLIDADLRRPSLHRLFGLPNKVGLSNVITGQASIDNGCVQATSIPNLFVLLSGAQTPSPTELLSSRSMENILRRCAERFDMVVIDSAPLFPVVDSHYLAALSDAVLLVVRSRITPGPAVRSAIDLTKQFNGGVTGVVLNDVDLTDFAQHYYHRYYSYGYAPNPSQGERNEA